MTHLLDTDHISILEYGAGAEYAVLVANLNQHAQADVGLSVVSFQEQVRGCHNRIAAAKTPAQLVAAYGTLYRVIEEFRGFPLVPFDAASAAEADRIRPHCRRIGLMDLRIAAVALAHGLTLATRNAQDFAQVPGLAIVDWTK